MHDLLVIGGGPAGLSAALNGAAEGLDVVLLERDERLGGQAGTSSLIENYLGFQHGVSGESLTAEACDQARRLGAQLRTSHKVASVEYQPGLGVWVTTCQNGEQHVARAVLAAVGVDYRRLDVPGGKRVRYGVPADMHAEHPRGARIVVVGGGNSAGQAAMNLHHLGMDVVMVARRPLRSSMSAYLVERIARAGITVNLGNVTHVGDGVLSWEGVGHKARLANVEAVYAYIGSEPRTEFLRAACRVDEHGFLCANGDFAASEHGLFVAGDVRSGSRKRVAIAAGEGAIAAANVWKYINLGGTT